MEKGVTTDRMTRWERAVMRKPGLSEAPLRRLIAAAPPPPSTPPLQALLGLFFILERWGRGPELQPQLEQALERALQTRQREDTAELSEALGRLHYQRGDYVQACAAWSRTLEFTDDETRWACLARIGLAHLCFALGDWARGGRVLDQAEAHYPGLGRDPYLRAKIALNRAVSLRATQGPQAALQRLDEARVAAQAVGHRDYEAEAMWHQARCARDSGQLDAALQQARQAAETARRCRYRWLHAQALLLVSELQTGEAAVRTAEQALEIGVELQSRALQAAVHGRLSQLMAEQGALGPSWHHQQQRQRLEATLVQTELPARLEQLARFDTDPHGADALLLALSRDEWPLSAPDNLRLTWDEVRPRLMSAMQLEDLQLQWSDAPESPESPDMLGSAPTAERSEALDVRSAPTRAAALASRRDDLPFDARATRSGRRSEASAPLPGADAAPPERMALMLSPSGRRSATLMLVRPAGTRWTRADRNRAERLKSWLERLMERSLRPLPGSRPAAVARPAAARLRSDVRSLADQLEQLAAAPPGDTDQLEAALRQLAAKARELATLAR